MIDIARLTEICDEQCAAALGWFVLLGERVRDEPDPRLQRLYAVAAHRHAWHAELWSARRPAVPHDAVHAMPAPTAPAVGGDLRATYRDHLVDRRGWHERLRGQIDPELDPSTHRVIDLVDADLADVIERLG